MLVVLANLSLGRLETLPTTRASPGALHDRGLPGDTMNFEMSTEAAHRVAVKGEDPLMQRPGRIFHRAETAFESQAAAIRVETFPLVTPLVIPLVAPRL